MFRFCSQRLGPRFRPFVSCHMRLAQEIMYHPLHLYGFLGFGKVHKNAKVCVYCLYALHVRGPNRLHPRSLRWETSLWLVQQLHDAMAMSRGAGIQAECVLAHPWALQLLSDCDCFVHEAGGGISGVHLSSNQANRPQT